MPMPTVMLGVTHAPRYRCWNPVELAAARNSVSQNASTGPRHTPSELRSYQALRDLLVGYHLPTQIPAVDINVVEECMNVQLMTDSGFDLKWFQEFLEWCTLNRELYT